MFLLYITFPKHSLEWKIWSSFSTGIFYWQHWAIRMELNVGNKINSITIKYWIIIVKTIACMCFIIWNKESSCSWPPLQEYYTAVCYNIMSVIKREVLIPCLSGEHSRLEVKTVGCRIRGNVNLNLQSWLWGSPTSLWGKIFPSAYHLSDECRVPWVLNPQPQPRSLWDPEQSIRWQSRRTACQPRRDD